MRMRYVFLVGLVACAPSGTPEQRPGVSPLPRSASPDSAVTPTRILFSYKPGRSIYDHVASASVSMRGDSVIVPDTIATTARLLLRLQREDQRLNASLTVDSLRVTVGKRVNPLEQAAIPSPVVLNAHVGANGRITVQDSSLVAECDLPSSGTTIAAARELLRAFPQTFELNQQWRDTVQTLSCRGGVHMRATTVSDYTVARIEGVGAAQVVRVARRGTLTLSGEGQQAGQNVTVSGTGRTTGTLTIDVPAGVVTESESRFETELTLFAGDRSQQFLQRGMQRITRRPAAP